MRYNRFLDMHLRQTIDLFVKSNDKADIFLKKFFKNTNLGKRDRTWIRDRFFYYMRHRFLFDRILSLRKDLSAVIAMLYDNEPDKDLKNIIDEMKKNGDYLLLFDFSFPPFLLSKILDSYGKNYIKWFNSTGETTLRTNLLKTNRETLAKQLETAGYKTIFTKLSRTGLIVENNSSALKNTPLFKQGSFEFQDESSQLASYLVNPSSKSLFDCCGGSGGKSLAIKALFPHIDITASDIRRHLLKKIKARAERAGTIIKTTGDKHTGSHFDTVFIDAPCSGSGVLRRNPCDRWVIDRDYIKNFTKIQARLLQEQSRLVDKNGELIYVTCSFFEEENESVVENFLKNNPEFYMVSAEKRLKENLNFSENLGKVVKESYFKTAPGEKRDIFFGAILRKS